MRARAVLFPILVAAAVAFGAVITGSLHMTAPSQAQKASAPATAVHGVAIPSFADIAEAALKSVVTITSTGIVREASQQPSPFGGGGQDPFEFFFGPRHGTPQERRQTAGGSGFVVSEDGEILTNNHVVSGASKIQVKLRDREIFVAKVVGRDPITDVALIKVVPKSKLPVLALGDSDQLRVGDWVMAVGNPLFFEGTVTVGVVSGEGRRGLSDDPNASAFENLIQTDAAINFGNSGGPLINVAGQVVGINTAMIQPAQNIGFAVAINTVRSILPQLRSRGRVVRGMLGIQITEVDQDIKEAFHLPSMDGAFVEAVEPGQPAAKAGVQHGDTIVQVDDRTVREPKDLINYVSSLPPGKSVRLTVLRDGKTIPLTATLGERRSERTAPEDSASEGRSGGKLGIAVSDLTPGIRQQLGLPNGLEGVVVTDVRETSPAADKGIAPGDVITEINGTAVKSAAQLGREVSGVRKGQYVRLYVRRFVPEEVSRFVVLQPE